MVITGYKEKPIFRSQINAGIYAIEPSVLSLLGKSLPIDMPTLFELLQVKSGRAVAYPIHEEWLDIGRPADLSKANLKG